MSKTGLLIIFAYAMKPNLTIPQACRSFALGLALCLAPTIAALTGCSSTGHNKALQSSEDFDSLDFATAVTVRYAEGFSVDNHSDYKRLTLFNPGSRDTLISYILYPRNATRPELGSGDKLRYIPTPLSTIACASTTELGALAVLGLQERLVACASPQNVNDSVIRQRIERGQVVEIGRGMGRNIEQIIATQPDVYIEDIYSATDKDADIEASGIHIVYYNNWKEQHILGRAEWLKVIGLLLGRNAKAQEAYEGMVARYEAVRQHIAPHITPAIEIMYGSDYKGVWYVPGEYSYMTRLLADAGIVYDHIPGQLDSKPMSFEYVYTKHQHKKLWLCMMTGGLDKLEDFVKLNERYSLFEAVRSGQVWVDRKRLNANGGNDFWESGPYNPDLLLKDLVKISRPELLPDYETTYWKRLE